MSSVTKGLARAAALVVLGIAASGCATSGVEQSGYFGYSDPAGFVAPVEPPPGYIFAHFKAPLTHDFEGTPIGPQLTKVSSSFTRFIGIPIHRGLSVAWDDAGIAEIAEQGGLNEVQYAEYEFFNILSVYSEFTVHVYGN